MRKIFNIACQTEFHQKGGYMNATELVSELKNDGYDLYLEDENIRYKFHSLVEPPKERIAVLLDSLKRNKAEVISYLRAQESPNKATSSHDAGVSIQKMQLSEFGKAGLVVKVFSEVLQDHVFFVSNEEAITPNQLDLVSYTAKELTAMLDMQPEEVQAIYEVKTIFHRARVIEHRVSHGQL